MSASNLMDNLCDIYHFSRQCEKPKYGIPAKCEISYSDKPDIVNAKCHFKHDEKLIVSTSSLKEFVHESVILLPIETDIRFGDKIKDNESGIYYYALHPRKVRCSHIKVKLRLENSFV